MLRRVALTTAMVVAILLISAAFAEENTDNAKLVEARQSQTKVDEITSQMMDEMAKLETETHKKKVPLLQTRNNILKSVKGFWGRVIESHPSHINWFRAKEDKDILGYLNSVTVEDVGTSEYQMHHYRISFDFDPNPFFSDTTLWREVHGAVDETQPVSGVNWMVGKAPEEVTFFSFFEDPKVRQAQRLDGHLMNDVAHVIRYEFWPNPFTYHDLPNYNDYINDATHYHEGEHTHDHAPPPHDGDVEPEQQAEEPKDDM